MPTKFTVPLAEPYNSRVAAVNPPSPSSGIVGIGIVGIMVVGLTTQSTGKDTRYINCFKSTVGRRMYVVKRPGFGTGFTPAAGNAGYAALVWTGSASGTDIISAFGATNSTIYSGNTSLGAITGRCTGITESVTGATDATLAFTSSDNTGWYTTATAVIGAVTFTGATHTNTTIDGISSTAGLLVGQLITGTGIQANTRIASIDSAVQITTTIATTASASITITRSILAKIIDPDFPGNTGKTLAGTFSHLKGFACVLTRDGLLYAGDINTMSAWTSNSFDSTNTSPDKGVASFTHKEFVATLNEGSMEFWYNAGLTPFPLARASAKTTKVGLVAFDAWAQISDTSWFAGSTPEGGLSIFQYDGSSPQRVSTPSIDATLILAGAANISLTTIRNLGYSFVYVRAASITHAYCIEEKFWFEVNGEVPLWYKVVGVSQGSTMVNYAISNVSTSGKVYVQNHSTLNFEDDGATYTARGQTANEDQGTNKRKFYSYIDIVSDTEASASPLTIFKSDDDFQTYDILGEVDLSQPRKRLTRLGAAEQRSWAFAHSANTPMRLQRIEGEMEVGN